MKVGVPAESGRGEFRVALVPDVVRKLSGAGVDVVVQHGAGTGADIPDAAYAEAGAAVSSARGEVWQAEVVAKVRPPTEDEIASLRAGSILVGLLAPLSEPDTVRALAAAGVTAFALEAVPRITRAQSMDALSSQATVAGYRAVLVAATELGRFFPMLTTAAGTVAPAKVLILGAGVAGLQAIATARRLGAVVSAFDVRAAVKEQVESLGARFLELELGADGEGEGGYAQELDEEGRRRQQEALSEAIASFDAVITTALVPGRPAPLLIPAAAVGGMRTGSVIVDLAADAGGNCELSEPGRTIDADGVTIAAPLDLPSAMAEHASQLYSRNIAAFIELLVDAGQLRLSFDDEILAAACITHNGEIVHEGAAEAAARPVS